MTIKSLFNWGGFGDGLKSPQVSIERWHSGGWEHKSHGHGYHKGGDKSGGGNAVLSALALLAFLFLINVMQQSLHENNSTATTGTTTALLIREENSPFLLNSRGSEMMTKSGGMESSDTDDIHESLREISNQVMSKNGNT